MAYNYPAFSKALNWICSNQEERVLPEILLIEKAIQRLPIDSNSKLFTEDDFFAYHAMLLGNTITKSLFRYFSRLKSEGDDNK